MARTDGRGKVITWASQREPKFKNALRYFCSCFLPSVTNRRLGPNTHAHDQRASVPASPRRDFFAPIVLIVFRKA